MPEFVSDHTPHGLDSFTRGYLECAEWLAICLSEDGEERADFSLTDDERAECEGFSPEAIAAATADCADFQAANESALSEYYGLGHDESHAGHDFYLSRNGHGAGFFDRGNEAVYDRLQEAARGFGGADCMYDPDSKTLGFM